MAVTLTAAVTQAQSMDLPYRKTTHSVVVRADATDGMRSEEWVS